MTDIDIRIVGQAGRITLRRPKSLNALTYQMCTDIEAALETWREDDSVAQVILDAEGDRAFCSGGDIADLYAAGRAGDFAFGRQFWADEYRLNHRLFTYPKPVISFLQGFTMGGGVGLGCHGSHRIVGDSSQIAMPECGIGLVPDVGGSLMLAKAPGRLGTYLGITCSRMGAADAIYAGFADHYLPEHLWTELIHSLEQGRSARTIADAAQPIEPGPLQSQQADLDALLTDETLEAMMQRLRTTDSDLARDTAKRIARVSPLSAACTLEMLRRLRASDLRIETALDLEYRFTARASEQGDFLEGIRAAIIDKDRAPAWQYAGRPVPNTAIDAMLAPLGTAALTL